VTARRLSMLALSAALLTACGGSVPTSGAPAQEPKQAPEAPAGGAYPQQQEAQPGDSPAPRDEAYDGFAEPPAAEPAAPGGDKDDATRSVEEASLELDRAASELSAAGTDCARVCKALGSMNRASERICALEPDASSSSRCRRAKERVAEAAVRVRRSCTCP
jgi:hypothetical protein